MSDERADKTKQLQYVQILGEVSQPLCVPTLINVATKSPDGALQAAALRALGRYDDSKIASAVIDAFAGMTDDVRAAAGALLTSRAGWTLALLQAIDSRRIEKSWLSLDLVQRMMMFYDSNITSLVQKLWPDLKPATSDELKREINRITQDTLGLQQKLRHVHYPVHLSVLKHPSAIAPVPPSHPRHSRDSGKSKHQKDAVHAEAAPHVRPRSAPARQETNPDQVDSKQLLPSGTSLELRTKRKPRASGELVQNEG